MGDIEVKNEVDEGKEETNVVKYEFIEAIDYEVRDSMEIEAGHLVKLKGFLVKFIEFHKRMCSMSLLMSRNKIFQSNSWVLETVIVKLQVQSMINAMDQSWVIG